MGICKTAAVGMIKTYNNEQCAKIQDILPMSSDVFADIAAVVDSELGVVMKLSLSKI